MTARGEPENANRQAADWLARLHADDRDAGDEAAFRQWVAANPANADAFERASAIWDAVGGIGVAEPVRQQRLSRRAVMAGGAALIVAGGATFGWREATAGVYRTDIGEQRRVRLDDGTRVMLDTATRFRFRPDGGARTLSLSAGRIDLEVAADTRPFVIMAGDRAARLMRGRVDVRRDDDRTEFTAIEGSLAVGSDARMLAPAHRITLADGGRPDRIDRPEMDDLTAWQSGRLAFRNQTLAGAAAEMNRYSLRPLLVEGREAAAMRFSGLYRAGDPEAFARSVALLLPVRVEADDRAVRIFAAS